VTDTKFNGGGVFRLLRLPGSTHSSFWQRSVEEKEGKVFRSGEGTAMRNGVRRKGKQCVTAIDPNSEFWH
jgi:hypothetical protein